MGPAPKPAAQRRRRNATPNTVKLPASGRVGSAPRWPLIPDIATKAKHDLAAQRLELARVELDEGKRGAAAKVERLEETVAILAARLKQQRRLEGVLWRDLWKSPQAVRWEHLGWTREVAQYVRWQVLGELGDLDAAKEARQWSDRLGLSPMALLRLRWEVVDDDPPADAPTGPGTVTSIASRARPRVVDE